MSRVRGWCPSAHRPMASGDGLLVRVKPRLGRLSAERLCHVGILSVRFGNGVIDLTSRGNLQIRGVAEADHAALLEALIAEGLVDADPAAEASVTVTPFWEAGDLTARLGRALEARLPDLPALPAKTSVVVDTGPARLLAGVSGDFRLERGLAGGVILRADGSARGRPVEEGIAVNAVLEMAHWFLETGGREAGRMRRHRARLPEGWTVEAPVAEAVPPGPDPAQGRVGVAFGQIRAQVLQDLLERSGADEAIVTPWRLLGFRARGRAVAFDPPAGLIADPADPRLAVDACPGAPFCAQAEVETRGLARDLAGRVSGRLHVSGCAKGCARAAPAEVTLVGRAGRFDLVRNGRAGDTPVRSGMSGREVRELLG